MIAMPSRYQTTEQITTYLHQMVQQLNYELNKEDNDYVTRTEMSKAIETQSATINKLIVKEATEFSRLSVTGATTLGSSLEVKGNTIVGDSTVTTYKGCYVRNAYRYGGLHASEGQNLGVIDFANNRWIIFQSSDNKTSIPCISLNISGATTINNRTNIYTTGNQLKIATSSSGIPFFIRNDGNNTYLLVGDSGADTYNNRRPFTITNSNGEVSLGNGALWVNQYGNTVIKTNNCGLYGVKKGTTNGYVHLIGLNANNQTLIAGDSSAVRIGNNPQILSLSGTMQIGAASDSYVTYISGAEARVCNTAKNTYAVIKASAFTVSSTRRLKDNIEPMTAEHARKIKDLEVVTFDYKNGDKNRMGLIAEDAVNVYPSCVFGNVNATTPEEIMGIGIDYSGYIPPLIKNQQLMMEDIQKIFEEIAKLKNN